MPQDQVKVLVWLHASNAARVNNANRNRLSEYLRCFFGDAKTQKQKNHVSYRFAVFQFVQFMLASVSKCF